MLSERYNGASMRTHLHCWKINYNCEADQHEFKRVVAATIEDAIKDCRALIGRPEAVITSITYDSVIDSVPIKK